MSKYNVKELLGIIIFSIINIVVAFFITSKLGIQNVILYKSLTAIPNSITYEIIIFMLLSIVECTIYHFKYETKK